MDETQRSVTIPLTDDQRRRVLAAVGRDAVAVQVGSAGVDDEWVVLVWKTEPQPEKENEEK